MGFVLFKRRKPDDVPEASDTALPAGLPPGPRMDSPEVPAPPGMDIAHSTATPGRLPEAGFGVPPYRPSPPKEAPAMSSRPPLSPSAATAANGAAPRTSLAQATLARTNQREPAERRTLVVGRGISLQGTVQDAERLVVEGTVEATMIHAAELSIAQGGVFKGEVEVEDAEIAGTIDGTLTAKASLVIRASGRVMGTARCRRLQVEDGGQISGRIEMITGETGKLDTPYRSTVEAPG